MREQRAYTRFNEEGCVVLKPVEDPVRAVKADLIDICSIGFGVCAPDKIEVGTQVKFELTIKSYDEPLIGEGKIAHTYAVKKNDTQAFRMGIAFTNIDSKRVTHFISIIQHDIAMKTRNKR